MPVPIVKEPDELIQELHRLELCCFCFDPTPYWTNLKKRAPGGQVACCPGCAKFEYQKDVPSKNKWYYDPRNK
jgi:hypothetical protein